LSIKFQDWVCKSPNITSRTILPESPTICLSRDIEWVSELYVQSCTYTGNINFRNTCQQRTRSLCKPCYYQTGFGCIIQLYRACRKSVNHFKNAEQINCASDHGNSDADSKWIQALLRARACSFRDLPLEDSNSEYGVQ
jgi:hypothetical protein